jgi:predicted component of type VI protein secretion system
MRIKLKVVGRQTVVRHNPAALRVDGSRRYYFLGKGADCFLSCEAADVRPRHCAIVVENDAAMIYAVDPDGSIEINGAPVRASQRLESGDSLQIGSVRFEVIVTPSGEKSAPSTCPPPAPQRDARPDSPTVVVPAPVQAAIDSSADAQIGQWLDAVDAIERQRLLANPELRRFHLEPAAVANDRDDTREKARDESSEIRKAEAKKTPSKLPVRPNASARSDEAAANLLTRTYGKSIDSLKRKPRE